MCQYHEGMDQVSGTAVSVRSMQPLHAHHQQITLRMPAHVIHPALCICLHPDLCTSCHLLTTDNFVISRQPFLHGVIAVAACDIAITGRVIVQSHAMAAAGRHQLR